MEKGIATCIMIKGPKLNKPICRKNWTRKSITGPEFSTSPHPSRSFGYAQDKQRRGMKKAPSPLAGEGWGEGGERSMNYRTHTITRLVPVGL